MVKFTLGEKGQRLKWTFFSVGILLIVLLTTCHILIRVDWASFGRKEFVKHLKEIEDQVVLENIPPAVKVRKLMGRCNKMLRDRGMAGYLCDTTTGEYFFVGRLSADFRVAVEKQKRLIDSGKAFDEKSIPKLHVVVEFEKLHCRCLIAEVERMDERSR